MYAASAAPPTPQTIDLSTLDPGIITIKVPGGEATVDVYDANNRIADAERDAGDNVNKKNAAIVAVLAELGFPAVSQFVAGKVCDTIATEAAKLSSFADGPGVNAETQGSPDSSAPPS